MPKPTVLGAYCPTCTCPLRVWNNGTVRLHVDRQGDECPVRTVPLEITFRTDGDPLTPTSQIADWQYAIREFVYDPWRAGQLAAELEREGVVCVQFNQNDQRMVPASERLYSAIVEHRLTLPDDPVPEADAIVGVGHALNYLPDLDAIERALGAIGSALRPGGVLAIDLCDLEWARERADARPAGWLGDDWALITEFSIPSPDRFVRQMATFIGLS